MVCIETLPRAGDVMNDVKQIEAECIMNNCEFIILPALGCICKQTTHIH